MAILDNILTRKRNLARVTLNTTEKSDSSNQAMFRIDDSYLRIAIEKLFIKNTHSLLNTYLPLIYSKVTFMAGDGCENELLKIFDPQTDDLTKNAGLLQFNQHVTPLIPFVSPVLKLKLGLFKVKKSEHTSVAIKLLNSFTSLDLGLMAQTLKVIPTVLEGIDSLVFGEEAFILGIDETYDHVALLVPGYRLIVNDDEADQTKFFINNNELFYGDEDLAVPYKKNDYLIYRIDVVDKRYDFRQVDPIPKFFNEMMQCVKEDKIDELKNIYKYFTRSIITSNKFTLSDKRSVIVKFQNEIQESLELANTSVLNIKAAKKKDSTLTHVTETDYERSVAWEPK